jgi:predicted 3-demethylubiquinone-9 3-methyltransferase (glyoxalase superfamily)
VALTAGQGWTETFEQLQLEGQKFVTLNCGPLFKFTEAISFVVNCKTPTEVDTFWKQLRA